MTISSTKTRKMINNPSLGASDPCTIIESPPNMLENRIDKSCCFCETDQSLIDFKGKYVCRGCIEDL